MASQGILSNLRNLRFNASLNRPFEHIDIRVDSSVKWRNLRQLAGILQHSLHRLPRLHEVAVYARLHRGIAANTPRNRYNWNGVAPENAWAIGMVSESGKWDEIENLLGGEDRGAPLAGCAITRTINVEWFQVFKPVFLHQLRGSYSSVHVHSAKSPGENQLKTITNASHAIFPRTSMRFMNADGILTDFTRDYESNVLNDSMRKDGASQD